MSAHGQGARGREVSALPDECTLEEGQAMAPGVRRCVVGIAVAQHAHVVCALEAPGGALCHKPSPIEATTEGYALLLSWLATWRAGGEPEAVLIGLEATGVLWEPLSDALTQAGYTALVLTPRQTASWPATLGPPPSTDQPHPPPLPR